MKCLCLILLLLFNFNLKCQVVFSNGEINYSSSSLCSPSTYTQPIHLSNEISIDSIVVYSNGEGKKILYIAKIDFTKHFELEATVFIGQFERDDDWRMLLFTRKPNCLDRLIDVKSILGYTFYDDILVNLSEHSSEIIVYFDPQGVSHRLFVDKDNKLYFYPDASYFDNPFKRNCVFLDCFIDFEGKIVPVLVGQPWPEVVNIDLVEID